MNNKEALFSANKENKTTYLKRSNLSGATKQTVKPEKQKLLKQQQQLKKQMVKELNREPKHKNTNKQNPNNKQNPQNTRGNTQTNNNRNRNNNFNNRAMVKNNDHIQVVKRDNFTNTLSTSTKKLKIMFLGGVGEVGKNMMAVEFGNEIIIVDSGSAFPGEDLPGIDLIIPDISYLLQNKHKVKAVVLTHGHEDHIGSLPYLLNEINVPVYGSRMAIALVNKKFKEHKNIKPKLVTVKPKQTVKLGHFSVEFIHVNHSIAGAFALSIKTPVGMWFHTGDFKIDFNPIDGVVTDLARIAEIGSKGVMLLTADSTNVERPGYTMSESTVGKTLDVLFSQHKTKRIFVATFASNIYRLQQLMDLAVKYKRKVAFSGRSMINVSEVAAQIGELKMDSKIIVPLDRIKNYKPEELLVVSTGSQGEPFSALTRMSAGNFKGVNLGPTDAIIISASPIPGNEKAVGRVINNLYKTGCTVIYDRLAEVHVSGHAKQEELKIIHTLVKPKFFVPAHGEYRMLKTHADLAVGMGRQERSIIIPAIGDRIEFTKTTMKRAGTVTAGRRLVDGLGFGEMESVVLRDRKLLAEDGLCLVMLGVNAASGELVSGPDIITRGFMYSNESDKMLNDAKQVVIDAIKDLSLKQAEWSIVKDTVRRSLRNHFYRKTKRRPMILTFVVES